MYRIWTRPCSGGSLGLYNLRTLKRLVREDMRFAIASAGGCGPIRIALDGLYLTLPVINQNGAFPISHQAAIGRSMRLPLQISHMACGRCFTRLGADRF